MRGSSPSPVGHHANLAILQTPEVAQQPMKQRVIMSSIEVRSVSIPVIAGIYTATFVGLTIFLSILVFPTGHDPSLAVVFVMAAAAAAADHWFSREKAVPASGRAWSHALFCGIASAVLSVALVVIGSSGGNNLWEEFSGAGVGALIGMFALIVILHTLFARLGFWLSFWQAAKKSAA